MDLLLSAFPPELGPWLKAPPDGWIAACTGVGPLAAAAETARLIVAHRPERVLFVGTCGTYDEAPAVGSVVSAARVVDVTLAEVRNEAYRPGIQVSAWSAGLQLPFPPVGVVATPAITCTEAGAMDLLACGQVEHLELGGIAAACALAKVPFGAVLGVANRVGPNAQSEWQIHHRLVSESLRAALLPVMAGGGW